jgi:hypothetical protein
MALDLARLQWVRDREMVPGFEVSIRFSRRQGDGYGAVPFELHVRPITGPTRPLTARDLRRITLRPASAERRRQAREATRATMQALLRSGLLPAKKTARRGRKPTYTAAWYRRLAKAYLAHSGPLRELAERLGLSDVALRQQIFRCRREFKLLPKTTVRRRS